MFWPPNLLLTDIHSAMCEKQIMTPCNSILYCSEACRRKDDAKPLSASLLPASYRSVSAPTSPRATTPIPSNRETHSTTPVVRIPSDLYDHKSDLDPTEWKPKLQHRGQSDAYQYLSKFHAALNAQEDEYVRVERRRYGHKHNVSMTTTPTLGNTPSTAASSVDSIHDSTRPLHPRTNPMYTLSAGAKSVDLVTPHIPPPIVDISTPTDSQMTWDKKVILKNANESPKGVGILFSSAK
jgi:ECL1/2/3 zinc binding proteins